MATPQIQVGSGLQGLLKDGYKDLNGLGMVIMKNIEACRELGKITRTSLGPNGMNKMVINHLDKIFVTSDAATIMAEMEVIHPAAKMIVMAACVQEKEFGDCTNLVITFASEMLYHAGALLRIGVHPSEIISGYKKATTKALESLSELSCCSVKDVRDPKQLEEALRAVVGSKHYGYEDFLAEKVAKACSLVIPCAPKAPSLNMDNVRTAKLIGGNIHMTEVLKGMVIRRPPSGEVERVENAKIAVFGTAIEAAQTETKGTVCITSADELLSYNKSEEDMLDEQIRGIKESGVDVVISGGSISEMAMHFINRYKLLAVRITSKWELRRICRTVGATALVRLGPVMPDEMGHCDLVETREIAGGRCVVLEQNQEESRVSSIIIRSSTTNQLDDLERAMDDGINNVKTLCKDNRLLPGGGACDIALASIITEMGESTPGLEQYAINKFAEALEVIPRTLAENAGKDPTKVISSLYAAHKAGNKNAGLNVDNGEVADMHESKVYDVLAAKYQAIKLACDAAITILRVDQIIMSKQAGGPKLPKQ